MATNGRNDIPRWLKQDTLFPSQQNSRQFRASIAAPPSSETLLSYCSSVLVHCLMVQDGFNLQLSHSIPTTRKEEGAKKGKLFPMMTLSEVVVPLWLKFYHIDTSAAREARKYILYSDSHGLN